VVYSESYADQLLAYRGSAGERPRRESDGDPEEWRLGVGVAEGRQGKDN
jgi:hypothetical protein